ncbi:CBS domain-containing protein [Pedobacter sp. BS3]|uniref:chloride channel protein n=1 Tax=Pedobacter sp. BS3 TaxID=2567937 RepID=UPI0011EDC776|nr:chloride channel protein [Pedobacter sp. BS3]TZF85036.1 CBS domain-containing protein [Pedobacter sp. BS3]
MNVKIVRLIDDINHYRKTKLSNKHFLVIAALLVGIVGGVASSVLQLLTHHIARFLQDGLHWKYKFVFYLFFPMIGILLAVAYVRRFIRKDKFETGLTPILYAISQKSSRIPLHNIYSQIITAAATVGFGGSAGLESPIVYSGSAIGSNIGRFFGLSYRETTMLLACGAAAGISGVFNSPIAGIVFAVEILLPEFSIPAFIPLLIAAAVASIVSKLIFTEQIFYLVTEGWEVRALFFYLLMAIAIGFFSIYVTKLTYLVKGNLEKISNPYSKVIISGLGLGLLIFIFPVLYGEGYITIKELLIGNYRTLLQNGLFETYQQFNWVILLIALLTLFGKSLAAMITLYSGGNAGIFAPSLVMGGLLGFVFAFAINLTGLFTLNISNFIVAGMAGALSGIMHAPLTGVFLIAEITGGYALMVPLMLVSAISYFINKASQRYSIYTKVLAEKGELLTHEDKDRTVIQMMKLKYLIEKNFIELHPEDTPQENSAAIIHSKRNVFPVTRDGKLVGIVYSEPLFEALVNNQEVTVKELMQQPAGIIHTNDAMTDVMQKMDKQDIWILPVLDEDDNYVGFVSKSSIFNKYRALMIRQNRYWQ